MLDVPATKSKCSKCQKELEIPEQKEAIALCSDCAATKDAKTITEQKSEQEKKPEESMVINMDIDTDLTTTETMKEMDELDNNPEDDIPLKQLATEAVKQPEKTTEPAETKPATPVAKVKPEPAAKTKPEPVAETNEKKPKVQPTPPRATKVTRSNLNGTRSPSIIKRLRKSTRSTRFKAKLNGRGNVVNGTTNGQAGAATGAGGTASTGSASSKGKSGAGGGFGGAAAAARNRRALFKRPAQKTPRVQACTRFVKSVFNKGSYMQIGDIVSIVDSEQNVYYAQIRGLLVDAYCEKSAFLTWLIPTQDSPDPKEGFDPATYLIGPDEELSRKLSFLEFIMHAPSNYYYDNTTPFPLPDMDEYTSQRAAGYIWTRLPTVKRERERKAAA
ncbi:CG13367 [Drosophila busckii]|uniref:CG13367 n=1 Tax=Drosophila busckii TaxID=30019 RepID=A0A0M4EQW0_DROBS|nr:uncharacterized protein LOC108605725 [Drosophila busckii]ALC48390.1 CG13367 [Drosophila busckii]